MNNASLASAKSVFGAGLLAAVAASLCCITPLLAVIGGLSGAAGAFAWVEPYRPYLVGLTVAAFVVAWYQQLRPKPAADCCAAPQKLTFLQSRGFLGLVTVLAAALLTFPYYAAILYPRPQARAALSATSGALPTWQTRTYRIGGMTCAACAQHVEQAVQQVPGVQAVSVSYDQATAQVRFDAAQAQPAQVESAINSTGYHILNPTSH
ncbi:hypothetical protein GCM10028824_17960 [Hymenobacter segetis]|uniref:Mercuric transport protein MerT n=1 Tax=Hymenobacter segetis TaxID=2025509 RepID=A0ABU9LWJ2_9BACT